MAENRQSLWDDENFTIETGIIPGRPRLSGAELGSGIIYYPGEANVYHRLAETIARVPTRRPSVAGLNVLWNAGSATEILNPDERPSEFVRVALKPSAPVAAELPEQFLGVAYATLLQADWVQPLKESVRDDLDVIGAFVEPLRHGQRAAAESFVERAVLAKEDLDLKLFWCAGQYRRHGVFTLGNPATMLAVAATTGMINVSANTVDTATNPVHGCGVWYVAYLNKDNNALYNSFGQLSTPTSESLTVGNYHMWAEKDGKTGQKRKVSISTASGTQSVDLYAP